MRTPATSVVVASVLAAAGPLLGDVETESFDGGVFTNRFFVHAIEFDDPCCWEIVNCDVDAGGGACADLGVCMLHLRPNTDLITFDLPPGMVVASVSVTLQDFEGGFVGDLPTSAVVVRASSNDFVSLHASEIATPDTVFADVETIGQLFGEPLGDIVSIHLQVANEGNSVCPGVGAYFDDLTVTLVAACPADVTGDGTVGVPDLLTVLSSWGPCGGACPGDVDGSGTVDVADFLAVLAAWGPC